VIPPRDLVIAFLAPPWGEALSPTAGLDLRLTEPPVTEVVGALSANIANPLLCAIQVFETVDLSAQAEVESRFDWSQQRIYEFNAPGANHGLLLGTSRWRPGTHVNSGLSMSGLSRDPAKRSISARTGVLPEDSRLRSEGPVNALSDLSWAEGI
jgi:hypothetical protein